MGPEDLAQVLSGLPEVTDPNVLVGANTAEDAAVYRVSDELALIQTVDFFTPVVDDPYWFGAIAAANSLSDVYAMGGEPALALNIVAYPTDNEAAPLSALAEVLRGGAEKANEAGIDIVGGHTVQDNEPKYGLCVTGFVHPDRMWRNVGARPGDHLVLTKPLGVGIITTALRADKATEETAGRAIETMAVLNRDAAAAAKEVGVRACTDVTGFGLLGHLGEMLGEGDLGARVKVSAVPVLEAAWDLLPQGMAPGGAYRNRQAVEPHVCYASEVSEEARLLLNDPQTSGGLLFAAPSEKRGQLISALEAAGAPVACDIGEITADGRIEVVP